MYVLLYSFRFSKFSFMKTSPEMYTIFGDGFNNVAQSFICLLTCFQENHFKDIFLNSTIIIIFGLSDLNKFTQLKSNKNVSKHVFIAFQVCKLQRIVTLIFVYVTKEKINVKYIMCYFVSVTFLYFLFVFLCIDHARKLKALPFPSQLKIRHVSTKNLTTNTNFYRVPISIPKITNIAFSKFNRTHSNQDFG